MAIRGVLENRSDWEPSLFENEVELKCFKLQLYVNLENEQLLSGQCLKCCAISALCKNADV